MPGYAGLKLAGRIFQRSLMHADGTETEFDLRELRG